MAKHRHVYCLLIVNIGTCFSKLCVPIVSVLVTPKKLQALLAILPW